MKVLSNWICKCRRKMYWHKLKEDKNRNNKNNNKVKYTG